MSLRGTVLFVPSVIGLAALLATPALATPSLQLDLITTGGNFVSYDSTSDTTITSQKIFTVRALLTPTNGNPLTDNYFLSVALVPKPSTVGNYGSFVIGGNTVAVTADMTLGTPPLSTLYPDIGPHGIFPTYYKEVGFTFPTTAPNKKTFVESDIQTHFGGNYAAATTGDLMYAAEFLVDTTNLAPGLGLHFDLYNENTTENRTTTLSAPFSHDAEYRAVPTPEPTSLALWGLCGLGLIAQRRRKNA